MGGTKLYSGTPARCCCPISPNGTCSRGCTAVDMSMTSSESLPSKQTSHFNEQFTVVGKGFLWHTGPLTFNGLGQFGAIYDIIICFPAWSSLPRRPLNGPGLQRSINRVCLERSTRCEHVKIIHPMPCKITNQTSAPERVHPKLTHHTFLYRLGCRGQIIADGNPSHVGDPARLAPKMEGKQPSRFLSWQMGAGGARRQEHLSGTGGIVESWSPPQKHDGCKPRPQRLG